MLGLGAPIRGRHGTIRNFKTYVGDGTLEDGKRPADSRTLTAFYLVERDSSGADNHSNNRHQPWHRLERPRAVE